MSDGYCSACLQPARRVPSGRWWHLGPECPARSITIFRPATIDENGVMGVTPASQRPAKFVAT